MLAGEVEEQWDREAGLRQLYQPVPLQVRWSSTGRPVAASRDVVLGESANADWRQLPLQGDADEIVAAFRRLPYRQLVVLGEAGAGKSVLAMLLTLRLLKDPEPGQLVPVLLPIASWDPAKESVRDFLARRLGEDYPSLAGHGEGGQTLAQLLVVRRGILPVLDGLDELPAGMHSQAVQALDGYAAPDRPLVVTCRSREYEQAVRNSGSVLSRSAVVEIEPVSTGQAIDFLSHPAPSRPRWQPVFEHLREHPDSPLARTFSTPLMVALARAAYRGPDRNPAGLLVLADDAAVTGALLDGFVTSVYRDDQPGRRGSWLRPPRAYDAGDAARWLSCLAYHLYLAGTRDLWWWQLRPGFLSPRPARTRRGIPAAYALAAAACGFAIGLAWGLRPAIWAAVAATLIVSSSAAGRFGPVWPAGYPPYPPQRYRPFHQRRIRHLRVRASFGAVFGLTAGLLADSLLLGLAGGLACGLAVAIIPGIPVRTARWRSTPHMTFRLNRRHAIYAAVQYGLTCGVIFAVLARFTAGPGSAVAAVCTAVLIYALAAACGAGLWTWTLFRTAHVWLAVQGRLPWRLWAFLNDAHARGALRQAGTSWQFRHALLQDHLARKTYLEHLRARADAGDKTAARQLADLLAEAGQVNELRGRADAGDRYAVERLADLLAGAGRIDEAITVLRGRAEAGDRYAAERLVDLLAGSGQVDEAITVLRARADADADDEDAARQLASLLARAGRVNALRARADDGDPAAGRQLADLLARVGRVDELRARAAADDRYAAERLAGLLAGSGRVDEAIAVLRPRADAGDRAAARHLADLLAGADRVDEAIAVLRPRADAGDRAAARHLADLLAGADRVDEAIAVLRPRADVGDWYAARRLADVLAGAGRVDELRARAAADDRYAAERLADLLAGAGRVGEAIAVLRPRADAGDRTAAGQLADLLAAEGWVDELRARADAGDHAAARRLADLLAAEGRVDELRARADAGDHAAARRLADVLAGPGRADEAIAVLRARADAGDHAAARRLADVLAVAGRVDEAIAVLRPRADAGDRAAAGQLADVLAVAGRVDEAIAVLRPRAGDWDAAGRLADLLAVAGRVDELRGRADAGDRYAAERLAGLLAGSGQVDELRARADAGDWDAAGRLAGLLAGSGQVDELRARADAGDQAAARQLADLLARAARVDEAVDLELCIP
jgi:NACHT domain